MSHFIQEDKVRCCLIQLYGDLQPANAEPLSIETLAGAITSSIPTVIIDLQTFGNFQTLTEQNDLLVNVSNQKYNLIGISCLQGTYELALDILRSVYKHPCPPYVVLGNALPSSLPDLFLTQFPQVLIVRGWGEAALVELCWQIVNNCLRFEQIPSLTYLSEGGIRRDNPILWSKEAPLPHRVEPLRYFARVEATRGCHYNVCTFCSRPPMALHQPAWKRFDNRAIVSQIRQLVASGITTFTFTDEDFIGDDPQGALDLAQRLCDFPRLDFALSVRADNISNPCGSVEENKMRLQIFQTLKQAGLTLVFIGAESFVASQLHRYGKRGNLLC